MIDRRAEMETLVSMDFSRFCLGVTLLLGALTATAQAPARVHLATSLGEVVIEVDREHAPASAANFLRYVNDGFYDGTIFHRVIPGFMVQGGGLDADMVERATRPAIRNEADNGLHNRRGTVAMARTGNPHSATAQFFINLVDNAYLDFRAPTRQGWGYAVFARVVAGMDVVDRIAAVATTTRAYQRNVPVKPIYIERARVEQPPGDNAQ